MGNCLVAFAKKDPGQSCDWRVVSETGTIHARGESAFEDLSSVKHDKFILVLKGQEIASFRTPLSAKSNAQLRSIAPFAIEDDVSAEIEDQHVSIAYGDTGTKRYTLSVITNEKMVYWSDTVKRAGLVATKIVPDYFCLPIEDARISCANLVDRSVFRYGHWGACFDTGFDSKLLDKIIASGVSQNDNIAELDQLSYRDFSEGGVDPLDVLAVQAVKEKFSLQQGQFEARNLGGKLDLKEWRLPVGLAAAAILAMAAFNFVEGIAFNREAKALQATIEADVKRVFPDVKRIVNPKAQLKTLTSGNGEASAFLQLSGLISTGINDVDGISLDALRYDARRREIQASIVYEDYEQLTQFREIIENLGGTFREGGSRQIGNRRAGEITVTL
ncbi:type II secretion system protein GspL [Hirschia baltica]|uniref:General secretion pathway L n=1 Tax=Hirschia baltica (strain ATCC 49814 / DSM 5838 / IFAM 1418) TaxID=582402 RepID=C6XJ55_HIRBI|nr:type II secretion system protein GspL [Hirschia baltica]ACT59150.1 General secretion pathway L [Hirschia baltica ATCC 49814]